MHKRRVLAFSTLAIKLIGRITRRAQAHGGVAAQHEATMLATHAIFEPPRLKALARHHHVQAAVVKELVILVLRRGIPDFYVGQHGYPRGMVLLPP